MRPLAANYIQSLDPYIPGKAIPHLIKLASNENPFGPSPKVIAAAQKAVLGANRYPTLHREALKEKICEFHAEHQLHPRQIALGNGTSELITLLTRTLMTSQDALLNFWPSFVMYRLTAQAHGCAEITVPLKADLSYDVEALSEVFQKPGADRIKLLFLANPNNPTGVYLNSKDFEALLRQIPEDVVVVLDEAYTNFVRAKDYPNGLSWLQRRPRMVVMRTFSKAYGMAGFRIGYAVCDPEITDLYHRVRDPFNVNHIAQESAMAALEDQAYLAQSTEKTLQERARLEAKLTELGFSYTPSQCNFVLAHVGQAEKLCKYLFNQGIVVRPVANYGLSKDLRITVGTPEENDALFTALEKFASI
ncbi:MAG: histidinol-phosphate transaminase [Deltaproteobacteria bacterium]|nr:histidinol-phosphate transaminase [Deltaproteobacteria bacterium]